MVIFFVCTSPAVDQHSNLQSAPCSLLLDDFDSDIGDDDINEELALPPVLSGISNAEKRELYRFKRAHNEVRQFCSNEPTKPLFRPINPCTLVPHYIKL